MSLGLSARVCTRLARRESDTPELARVRIKGKHHV